MTIVDEEDLAHQIAVKVEELNELIDKGVEMGLVIKAEDFVEYGTHMTGGHGAIIFVSVMKRL